MITTSKNILNITVVKKAMIAILVGSMAVNLVGCQKDESTSTSVPLAPAQAPPVAAAPIASPENPSLTFAKNFRALDYDYTNVDKTELILRGGSINRAETEQLDKWAQDKAAFSKSALDKKVDGVVCEAKASYDADTLLGCYPINGVMMFVRISPENAKQLGKIYKGDEFIVSGTISSIEFFSDSPKNYLKKINGGLYESYSYQDSIIKISNGVATLIKK